MDPMTMSDLVGLHHCIYTYDQGVLTSYGLCANVLHKSCHTELALELLYSSFESKTLAAQTEREKQHML